MKIAYLTNRDPEDVHSWSGLTHFIAQSLKMAGNELVYVKSIQPKIGFILKLKQKLFPKLTGKFLQANRYQSYCKQYTKPFAEALKKESSLDFIFSDSSELIAAAPTSLPKAFWVDASFAGMLNYYPEFSILHPETVKHGNRLEQQAYDAATVVFFASEWAAQMARTHYNIPENKIKVVPFGANLNEALTAADIASNLNQKSFDTCELLFAGVDWHRKGGPLALKITQELNAMGIKAQLTITGCKPFADDEVPPFVKQMGFLSKKNPEQKKIYQNLFLHAHFLLVPSQAECYGLVYCEANAYGLPALATKTGGITTIIEDGVNGKTFDLNASATEYVAFIKQHFTNKTLYQKLSENAFSTYQAKLNWEVAGKSVTEILKEQLIEQA
ncbi:group 1 glycosyl transferase [Pedobacter yonginense]|uniref:Group 1 glycosyl transferase n=1 Tax=Pedobacter yonginense TaxID=651869 RepID=A0A317EIE7_9SPHI|nr:glycosyltransferase family 4 protein [Pedobacter yonginense]PWS26402.1 group 1 glycosyl transferase [Pedobacter yonginense]